MTPQNPADALGPEKMQLFLAGLSGLAPQEVRKAKLLYLRNAISEYNAAVESLAGFNTLQGCFAIIPFFWPVLYAQKRSMNAQMTLMKERISNAIEVWRDDLQGETFEIDGHVIRA